MGYEAERSSTSARAAEYAAYKNIKVESPQDRRRMEVERKRQKAKEMANVRPSNSVPQRRPPSPRGNNIKVRPGQLRTSSTSPTSNNHLSNSGGRSVSIQLI